MIFLMVASYSTKNWENKKREYFTKNNAFVIEGGKREIKKKRKTSFSRNTIRVVAVSNKLL